MKEVKVIESTYVRRLIMTVINNSKSDNWQEAVTEWEIYDCEEEYQHKYYELWTSCYAFAGI